MSKPIKAEAAYIARVVAPGCLVCRNNGHEGTPAAVHHIKSGITGAGLRSSWYRILALCPCHHQYGDGTATYGGEVGYHVSPEEFELRYGTQEDLLRQAVRELGMNPKDARFQARPLAEPLAA